MHEKPGLHGPVTTLSFFLHTLKGICISGGLFGLTIALIVIPGSGGLIEAIVMVPFGIVLGCVLATVSGVVCLSSILMVIGWSVRAPTDWQPERISLVSAVAGGVSGIAAVLVPSGLGFSVAFAAIVAGTFGVFGGLLGSHRYVARMKQYAVTNLPLETPGKLSGPPINPLSQDAVSP